MSGARFSLSWLPLLALGVPPGAAQPILVDHRHVELFEHIPPGYLIAARELRLLFSDRSVGQNIHESLDCLTAASWPDAPAACRRDYYDTHWNWKTYSRTDWLAGLVPARILFTPDPVTYHRGNWTFEFRSGNWDELTRDFIISLAPQYLPSKDVLSYQFSYLNVTDGSDIADPQKGFFANNATRYDVYDLEAFIAQHPDKIFLFWTSSLARGIGTSVSTDFNAQMRAYCRARGHPLLDMADIEAFTPDGARCFDNRDGVPYQAMNGGFENHPDDGHDYPAICQDYTTETDGGHLGSVSAGRVRIAKATWVMMARLAGWQWSYGDCDADGDIDWADYICLAGCIAGPAVPCGAGCQLTDADGDGDTDLLDLAEFQAVSAQYPPGTNPRAGCTAAAGAHADHIRGHP